MGRSSIIMKIAIIQARLNSTRLPRKVLLELPPGSGITVLERVVDQCYKSKLLDKVIVTTPDMRLALFLVEKGIDYYHYRGDRDVLREFYEAARCSGAELIVRITADCPLIRPEEIDRLIKAHRVGITFNTIDGEYGDGTDVEVFSRRVLEMAYQMATDPLDREHVTRWMRRFCKKQYLPVKDFSGVSLDTQKDYELICNLFEKETTMKGD